MNANSKLHILLADDDEDDRFLMEEAFSEAGCPVEWEYVSTDVYLIDRLESGLKIPDLVLLDWNLKPGGGSELVQYIRKSRTFFWLPVIVMSTSSVEGDIANAYLAGANAYLVKPPNYEQLVQTARSMYNFWSQIATLPRM